MTQSHTQFTPSLTDLLGGHFEGRGVRVTLVGGERCHVLVQLGEERVGSEAIEAVDALPVAGVQRLQDHAGRLHQVLGARKDQGLNFMLRAMAKNSDNQMSANHHLP